MIHLIGPYLLLSLRIKEIENTMADINRLKVVLVEKKKTNKWLASELKKDPATVSKWCTNTSQPDLQTLTRIAFLLGVEVRDLINKNEDIYENTEAIQ